MTQGARYGGRQAGTPNKVTAEVRALAQAHGPQVVAELVRLALHGQSERTRVAACREVLDRAYGRSVQELQVADVTPPMDPTERKLRMAHMLSDVWDRVQEERAAARDVQGSPIDPASEPSD
jgi:hypothetical protein